MRQLTQVLGAAAAAVMITLPVTTMTSRAGNDAVGSGEIKGREAIKQTIARMPQPAATAGMRPAVGRHNISNIVLTIDGHKASGRSYWFHYSNDNPTRGGVFDGFGHYEDELVKVQGKWLFSKRRIYNENRDEWAFKGARNPAW